MYISVILLNYFFIKLFLGQDFLESERDADLYCVLISAGHTSVGNGRLVTPQFLADQLSSLYRLQMLVQDDNG